MRQFIGSVVLESLGFRAPLAGLTPLAERVVPMPDDADAQEWHVGWYRLSEPELRARLPALMAAIRPHWYAHFWDGDDLCVILAGRAFWASVSDKATHQPFIEYGETLGVQRKWTESIPTVVPDWVHAALK